MHSPQRRIRTSLRNTVACLAVAILAGCGGDGGAETPLLPRDLAESLASRSDAVAEALDAGDPCRAAGKANQLRAEAIEAVNAGRIPERYQEDLLTSANELAASAAEECSAQAPPPPTTETGETTTETAETETEETEQDGDEGDDGGGDEGEGGDGDEEELIPSVSLTVPTVPADVEGRRSEKKQKKEKKRRHRGDE